MVRPASVLVPRPAGLYCPPADLYIDPITPVDRAVITHGHADHARPGHGAVAATPQTLAIMAERYGADFAGSVQPLAYGETFTRDGVEITLHPAGHVLGSAQAAIRYRGLTLVVSGDYKRRRDPTCAPFEPVPCHVFVTEATFGLPVFRHPPAEVEIARLLAARAEAPGRAVLVGAYALGKAQRLIVLLRQAGHEAPIAVHGALERLNALYARFGVELGPLEPVSGLSREALAGVISLAPPGALTTPWRRRFPDPLTAVASGWMGVRARARQRGVELPLIVSDHADWDELTATLAELRPEEVWITHGREEALLRWCELHGQKARALAMVGYDEEGE
ncbi:MAG: ligase-associated DNA damage response exonuclease [Alphaproteobacteria bacterium]|nr:ligase-associated DNA damage response exonuclease [Alphaproteobacteria bacterium]